MTPSTVARTLALLDDLRARGVYLAPAGVDGLDFDAPADELTGEDLDRIREHKPWLIALLRALRNSRPFPDGGSCRWCGSAVSPSTACDVRNAEGERLYRICAVCWLCAPSPAGWEKLAGRSEPERTR